MQKRIFIIVTILLSFQVIRAQYFQPVWDNPFNPMNVFFLSATINGIDIMEGSEIGIFDTDPNTNQLICVGSKVLEDEISPDDLFQVICSMDDGTSPGFANGFTAGNQLIIKIYTPTIGEFEVTEYYFPYPGYDETFTALGTAFIETHTGIPCGDIQTLTLSAGWSGISTHIHFINTSVDLILGPVMDKLEFFSNFTEFFSPLYPTGNLNYWSNSSGYFIKLDEEVSFEIHGLCTQNHEVLIMEGWNIVPVLSNEPVDIEILFSENIDKIDIIKEVAGVKVYWPEKQITTLQQLMPGDAYLIKAIQPFAITY